MKILSLFDGISCGRLALERAGIPVEKYYASEIDKYAIQVAQKNYPDTIQVGDVTKLNYLELLDVDMVIGGSPCQDLSIAKQNREGLRGARSGLFWKYVEALEVIHPKWFLLENVASMRNEDRDAITATLKKIYPETECIMINSALVSAQQRKRYYWTNWHVEQPQDKGVLLKDILESGQVIRGNKSHAVISSVYTDSMVAMPVPEATKKGFTEIEQGDCVDLTQMSSQTRRGRNMKDKSNCLTAGDCQFYQYVAPITKRSVANVRTPDEKANCLLSTSWKGAQANGMTNIPERVGQIGKGGQGDRIYSVRGKSVCLNANGGGRGAKTGLYKVDLPDGDYIIRKLTPVECERLQTLPDFFTKYGAIKWNYAKLMDAFSPSQIGKLNSVINTIFGSYETELRNLAENWLIKQKTVVKTDAKEKHKQLWAYVLNIIKNGSDNNQLILPKNVRFAITLLGKDVVECVLNTTSNGKNTETLYIMKLENTNPMATKEENIINLQTVDGCIKQLLKKYLEENSNQTRLYIISILINLIIVKAIFLCAKVMGSTYVSIDNLNILQGNSLEMELLGLQMESITEISNSSRYKAIGNGWTVDVIAWIFSQIPKD